MLSKASAHVILTGTLPATLLILSACAGLDVRDDEAGSELCDQSVTHAHQPGDFRETRSRLEHDLAVATGRGDHATAARLLLDLARLDESVGQYSRALGRAREALLIAGSLDDARLDAEANSVVGLVYRRMNDNRQARLHSEEALAVARRFGDLGLASESMRNLGAIQQSEGDYDEALDSYEKALSLAGLGKDTAREAKVLNNMGGIYRLTGSYQNALSYYESALKLEKQLQSESGQIIVLGNLCLVQQNLNALDEALDYCIQSVCMARDMGDRAREANNLNSIGAIYRERGEYSQSLKFYQRSLAIKQDISDRAGAARALNNIGELYLVQGKYDSAVEYLAESMQIQDEIGDRAGMSATHYNLGLIYYRRGDPGQALEHLEKALIIQLEVGERNLLWRIYDDLSRVYTSEGRRQVAILFGKLAVNTLQSVRGEIQVLDKAKQRAYLTDKVRAYRHLAGLLIDEGRLPEAQRVLNMLKDEEYVDFVVRAPEPSNQADARIGFRREEEPFAEPFLGFSEDHLAILREREALAAEEAALEAEGERLSDEKKIRRDEIDDYLEQTKVSFRRHFSRLVTELSTRQISEIDEATRRYLFRYQGTVDDVNELAGINAVMIHYVVEPDRLHIILTTSSTQVSEQVIVPAEEIYRRIHELRSTLLVHPPTSIHEPASALYDLLIRPIAGKLKEETVAAELLWVSMDGALRYVPLAALFDRESGRWLIQDYAVVMLTEVTKDAWKDVPSPDWRVAGLGLSRKVETYPDLSPLAAVEAELDRIVRREDSPDPDGILPGTIELNDDFTLEALEQKFSNREPFSVIHIASHFVLPERGTYDDAFLVLGNGDPLYLQSFLAYDFFGVELLTLSACNTAIGEQGRAAESGEEIETGGGEFDDIAGREVEGLGTLVQMLGGSSVLATLWEVADEATATFMLRFYQSRSEGMSKAEALRMAQLSFIDGDPALSSTGETGRGSFDVSGEAWEPLRYNHPYFWAPFVLMGNWL